MPTDKFNIMVIGDEEVGKTTILERYFNKKFNSERKKTIGLEYFLKTYTDPKTKNIYNIKFWDTAGQEKFHSVTKNYFQRADGMIITIAINKRSSFINLKKWINSVVDSGKADLPIIILVNKYDLESEREIENSEIEKFCSEESVKYFFTSAKDGLNIDESFDSILQDVIKSHKEHEVIELEEGKSNSEPCKC